MLLGGRSAEEIAFGEISTGAQNDLQRATDIARAMVTEFGMSDGLGVVSYDGHRRQTLLENRRSRRSAATTPRRPRSRSTSRSSGSSPTRTTQARQILRDHRDVLDGLSERLLEKEVIEAEELKAIMGGSPATDPIAIPVETPPVG